MRVNWCCYVNSLYFYLLRLPNPLCAISENQRGSQRGNRIIPLHTANRDYPVKRKYRNDNDHFYFNSTTTINRILTLPRDRFPVINSPPPPKDSSQPNAPFLARIAAEIAFPSSCHFLLIALASSRPQCAILISIPTKKRPAMSRVTFTRNSIVMH